MSKLRLRMIAFTAFLTLSLSACVGIPNAGEVFSGNEITGQEELTDGIVFNPSGPLRDAAPVRIVRDFINAATGQSNDYAVARSYLTGDMTSEWLPHERVYIFNSAPTVTEVSANEVRVDVMAVATVDSSGNYYPLNELVQSVYSLRQNDDGQWRIYNAPNGIMLANNQFNQLFSQHALYFYSANYSYLVPDLRWFPARYSRLTLIVSNLLDGPSEKYGTGVLYTAFPEGTELAIDSVVVNEGIAQVDVTQQVLTTSMQERRLMQAQLDASVAGFSSILRTQLMVDRAEVNVTPGGNDGPARNPQINPSQLVISQGRIGFRQRDDLVPVLGLSSEILDLDIDSIFLNERLNRTAIRTPEGIWVNRGLDAPRLLFEGAVDLDPMIDDYGATWWQHPHNPGIQISDGTQERTIAEDTVAETKFVSWTLSRDDTRLIALVQEEEQFQVLMYGVVRDPAGSVLGLNAPSRILSLNGLAIDVVWVNEDTIVFAWEAEDGDVRVYTQQIGGLVTTLGVLEQATSISPANTVRQVKVLDEEGQLYQLSGSNLWQVVSEKIDVLGKIR